MEKNTEQKMFSTMEILMKNVLLLQAKVDSLTVKIDERETRLNEKIDTLIRIKALNERMKMAKEIIDKHSEELQDIQDYLCAKKKRGKGGLLFFKFRRHE